MVKKKERSVNVSGKPEHSLDVNRDKGKAKPTNDRSAATDLQSRESPSTWIMRDRIMCYRRWFGYMRIASQKEIEYFREELQTRLSRSDNVLSKMAKMTL